MGLGLSFSCWPAKDWGRHKSKIYGLGLKKKLLQNVNNNSNLNFTLGDRNLDLGCGWIWAHPKALFGPPHPFFKVMNDY